MFISKKRGENKGERHNTRCELLLIVFIYISNWCLFGRAFVNSIQGGFVLNRVLKNALKCVMLAMKTLAGSLGRAMNIIVHMHMEITFPQLPPQLDDFKNSSK